MTYEHIHIREGKADQFKRWCVANNLKQYAETEKALEHWVYCQNMDKLTKGEKDGTTRSD